MVRYNINKLGEKMSQECEGHLAIWREWQQKKSEQEEIPPEVEMAIGHITSCQRCFDEVSRLSFVLFLEASGDERRGRLAAFLETEKQEGIEVAAVQNPCVTHYLVKNKHAFERIYAFPRAKAGFNKLTLPPDVAYTVERQLSAVNWVGWFAKHFGISKQGRLNKQAKATLEFRIDRAAARSLINRRMVDALAATGQIAQVQESDKRISAGETEKLSHIRLVAITTDIISASVQIDAERGQIRVILPSSAEYSASQPTIALISENGKVITKQANYLHVGYEATFSGMPTGNYLLAIDVVDRLKTVKPPLPAKPIAESMKEGKLQHNKDARQRRFS